MITKAIGVALCALAAYLLLKSGSPNIALLVLTAGGILLAALALGQIGPLIKLTEKLNVSETTAEYLLVMLKGVGIAFLAGAAMDVSRASGAPNLASGIETAAKIELLLLGVPFATKLIAYALALVS